ncbi:hypothetical protein R1sor_026698 [Riccia sorocarpa]|uniref:Uncharacterized protein n=1 Tax=Riccia sorocarpa TaxID=122646 RepID=A0ABD3GFF2_9MARC
MGKPSSWLKSIRNAIQNHVNEDVDYVRYQHLPHNKSTPRRSDKSQSTAVNPSPHGQTAAGLGESSRTSSSESSVMTKEFFPLPETTTQIAPLGNFSLGTPRKKYTYSSGPLTSTRDVMIGPFLPGSGTTTPKSPLKKKATAVVVAADVGTIIRNTGGAAGVRRMLEEWAAVTIQTAFRGFLARQALAGLKGLVRLQALVRGHLVRRRMQTILKIQSRMMAKGNKRNVRIRPAPGVNSKSNSNVPGKVDGKPRQPKPHSGNLERSYRSEDWQHIPRKQQLAKLAAYAVENTELNRLLEETVAKERALAYAEELAAQAKDKQDASSRRERALAYALLLTLTKDGSNLDAEDYAEIEIFGVNDAKDIERLCKKRHRNPHAVQAVATVFSSYGYGK